MKLCSECGNQLEENDVICSNCKNPIAEDAATNQTADHSAEPQYDNTTDNTAEVSNKVNRTGLHIAAFIVTLIGAFFTATSSYGFALLWIIPMVIVYITKFCKRSKIPIGFKICVLIFLSAPGGILLLCAKD